MFSEREERVLSATDKDAYERSRSARLVTPSRISWRATASPIPDAAPEEESIFDLSFLCNEMDF